MQETHEGLQIRHLAMNIRSITSAIFPYAIKSKDRKSGESAADRDPSHGGGGGHEPKRHLSEEELKAAMDHIRKLPGFQENNLSLRLDQSNGITILFIEDPGGRVVRRIPESEIHSLQAEAQSKGGKGSIIHKAM